MTKIKNNSNKARKRRNKVKTRVMALRARQREITNPGMVNLSSDQVKQLISFQASVVQDEFQAGRLEEEEYKDLISSLYNLTDDIWMYKNQFKAMFQRIKNESHSRVFA